MLLALTNVQKLDVFYKWNLIDKDDNKFVDCAIAINATKNDRLIYALYELHEEEISIVEGK